MNLISIITPIYYGQKYISKLYLMVERNSIELMKQYPDAKLEYILINDSPEVPITKPEDSRGYTLTIITNEENMGIHQSRVKAILNSESEFIYMLDQDDEIEDNFLISQYNKIANNDIVVSNGFRKSKDKNRILYLTGQVQKLVVKEKIYLYGTDMILSPGQCLIRRDAIPDVWYKNILKVNGCDDFALWLLMFERNKKFVINKEKLYYHIEDLQNYSSSIENMTSSYMKMCQMFLENNLLSQDKVKILIRRYKFKVIMKDEKVNLGIKLKKIVQNLDIVFYTLLYKVLGYY